MATGLFTGSKKFRMQSASLDLIKSGNDMERAYVIHVYEEEKPANKTGRKSAKVCSGRPLENPRFWLYLTLLSDVVECGTLAENPTTTIEGRIVRKKNVFTTNMRWWWLKGGIFQSSQAVS